MGRRTQAKIAICFVKLDIEILHNTFAVRYWQKYVIKYYSFYTFNSLIYFIHKPSYRVFSFLSLDTSGFCSSLEVFCQWQVGFSRKSEGDCAACKHER